MHGFQATPSPQQPWERRPLWPHVAYLRAEVQQLTSGLTVAKKRAKRKECLGIPSLRCSLPSRPVLEAPRPRVQSSGMGRKEIAAQATGGKATATSTAMTGNDMCPSPSRLHPQSVPRPRGLKRWTGCKGQPGRLWRLRSSPRKGAAGGRRVA